MQCTERRHQSGLIERVWVARCARCGQRVELSGSQLAERWEMAHARYGCRRQLVVDETGRGWVPNPAG